MELVLHGCVWGRGGGGVRGVSCLMAPHIARDQFDVSDSSDEFYRVGFSIFLKVIPIFPKNPCVAGPSTERGGGRPGSGNRIYVVESL
jgi:hypothetical protein